MKKAKTSNLRLSIRLFAMIGLTIYLAVFGSSILTNIHLKYLRLLSSRVVMLHNSRGSGATGFIAKGKSGKLYVMTNNHVCELEETVNGISGIFVDYQDSQYFLQVIKHYEDNDLCAVEAPKDARLSLKPAKYVELGESAYAVGHPQLEPLSVSVGELSDFITVTVVTNINTKKEDCMGKGYEYHTLETDLNPMYVLNGIYSICTRSVQANTSSMVISPGNSGSPVLNIWGNVIAVVFAANQFGTRSYTVPLADLVKFLEEL